ncbi:MAG: hypothetical protein OEV21_00885 [Thermoplasmata archaeon]|nr:hypothetical protein [Thermoplasmata archaeon]
MQKQVDKETRNDVMKLPDRVGSVVAIFIVIVVLMFFIWHSTTNSGFFTSGFGIGEAVLFYLVAIWGIVPQFLRAAIGRKNFARPIEAAGTTLTLIALIIFLITFPFDMTHFSDPLPEPLHIIFDWLSADIVKIFMVLGIIGCAIAIPIQMITYLLVKQRLQEQAIAPPPQEIPVAIPPQAPQELQPMQEQQPPQEQQTLPEQKPPQ